MITRRTVLFAALLAPTAASAEYKGKPQDFLGLWSGRWDEQWTMSIRVDAVENGKAKVHYAWPEGASDHVGTISGNTLKFIGITLTLTSATSASVVGRFSTATRRATVSKS